MRSAEQIGRTVSEYQEWMRQQRQQALRLHLAEMERCRRERHEWYVWATEGQPVLSETDYAAVSNRRKRP
jgi:hypothetical protein